MILRDEKNASQGEDKTERNKEREAGTRNKTTFLVQIFLNVTFSFFL